MIVIRDKKTKKLLDNIIKQIWQVSSSNISREDKIEFLKAINDLASNRLKYHQTMRAESILTSLSQS